MDKIVCIVSIVVIVCGLIAHEIYRQWYIRNKIKRKEKDNGNC